MSTIMPTVLIKYVKIYETGGFEVHNMLTNSSLVANKLGIADIIRLFDGSNQITENTSNM